jgi:putative mycofactocin binding protein MftB
VSPVVTTEGAWTLGPNVALRTESFGALAYHFGNRRLTFLKDPALLEVVSRLGSTESVAAALDGAGVPEQQRPAYIAALQNLADGDMIRPRAGERSLR